MKDRGRHIDLVILDEVDYVGGIDFAQLNKDMCIVNGEIKEFEI